MNLLQWLTAMLRKPDRYAELKRFPLFANLSVYELFQVSNITANRSFKAGELLFEQGYPVEAIFFIQTGEIELTGSNQPGGKRVLAANQIIGLIDMFNASTRSCTAKAISSSSVVAISRTDLKELIASNPRLGTKLLDACCKLLASHISEFQVVTTDR